jgi:hypothetical protein
MDLKDGLGKFVSKDSNETYEGEFKNDQIDGKGTFVYADGSKYTGDCLNGEQHGYGRLDFANGEYYEGQFANNRIYGPGKFVYKDGEYVGEFKNRKKSGQGEFTYSNGEKYVGSFLNDKLNGQGTFYFKNGYFKNNSLHLLSKQSLKIPRDLENIYFEKYVL